MREILVGLCCLTVIGTIIYVTLFVTAIPFSALILLLSAWVMGVEVTSLIEDITDD